MVEIAALNAREILKAMLKAMEITAPSSEQRVVNAPVLDKLARATAWKPQHSF